MPQHLSAAQAGVCIGYVSAVADLSKFATPFLGQAAYLPLTGLTPEEAAETVRIYLQDHPQERPAAAAVLVAEALSKAFPCPAD